ncbi:MAG: nucleotide-binding protein [Rhodoplanes sp.]|uniref:nucleotide-binding protein n=1 Tax=Rhodoplanes sp. TaxID=1968906 RepID=UPI0017D9942D|nr:nucleotide-binding protein [Rhodoplanes sp.]NVO12661.1 nucleotide-binding protein [Rhodoplanes sp.]
MTSARPGASVFIASSVEGLDVAYGLQEHLDYTAEPTVWTQDVFRPSSSAIVDLLAATRRFEFAIFAFTAYDVLQLRDSRVSVVRDNVIFEFGLFVGALGLSRCFFVVPRSAEPLHLPTDLLGLTPLTYASDRSDKNLIAALGPAANRVRRSIREQLAPPADAVRESVAAEAGGRSPERLDALVAAWNGPELLSARAAVREIPSSPYGYDDDEKPAHDGLRRLFVFLEALADAVISGEVDGPAARATFGQPVRILWPHMHVLLAPPNQAEEWWTPTPRLAALYARWGEPAESSG